MPANVIGQFRRFPAHDFNGNVPCLFPGRPRFLDGLGISVHCYTAWLFLLFALFDFAMQRLPDSSLLIIQLAVSTVDKHLI